jgi:siroheme synthase (precorrin-2 oxidase/ferrochelatase)
MFTSDSIEPLAAVDAAVLIIGTGELATIRQQARASVFLNCGC